MNDSVNWAQLVATGRAKAHGIPWTDEEAHARFVEQVPAEYVREGVLTQEDYRDAVKEDEEAAQETGEKEVSKMLRPELVEKAKSLGIEFTPNATVAALREVIKAKLEEEAEKAGSDQKEEAGDSE